MTLFKKLQYHAKGGGLIKINNVLWYEHKFEATKNCCVVILDVKKYYSGYVAAETPDAGISWHKTAISGGDAPYTMLLLINKTPQWVYFASDDKSIEVL